MGHGVIIAICATNTVLLLGCIAGGLFIGRRFKRKMRKLELALLAD